MEIKPIETVYRGHKFRSRLEARWAVFFDAGNIKYVYEPEGYEKGGYKYLPDFYLPEFDVYCEVKSSNVENPEVNESIVKACSFVEWGGPIKAIVFLSTIPEEAKDPGLWHFPTYTWIGNGTRGLWGYFYGENVLDFNISKANYSGSMGINNDEVFFPRGIEAVSDYALGNKHITDIFENEYDAFSYQQLANRGVFKALAKARYARFEHGETPE